MSNRSGNPAQLDWNDKAHSLGTERGRVCVLSQAIPPEFQVIPLADSLKHAGVPDFGVVAQICTENTAPFPEKRRLLLSYVFAYTFDFNNPDSYKKNPCFIMNEALLNGSLTSIMNIREFLFGFLSAIRTLPYNQYSVL